MMNRGLLYLLTALLLSAGTAFGQRRSPKLKIAEEFMYAMKYYEAADAYEEVLAENPNFTEIKLKLAKLYDRLNDLNRAAQLYSELLNSKIEDEPLLQYNYAVVLKKKGEYDAAIKLFEQFIKGYQGGDKSSLSKRVKNEIKGCERAKLSGRDTSFVVKNLKINSGYTELSPVFHENKLLYSSIPSDTPLFYTEELGIQRFMELYQVEFDHYGDSIASKPKKFGKNYWNADGQNITGGAFSRDSLRFYFSSCKIDKIDGRNVCRLYGTALTDSGWTTPKDLGDQINDPENLYSSTHPTLDITKRKKNDLLYFASNRPGGEGGYDLYEVELDDKFNPGKVQNLGRKINSDGNEITPFIDPKDQSLYYASDGLIGAGGYDIQKAKRKGRRLGKPKQLGYPFNTSYDDFFYFKYNKNKFLLVSNRPGSKPYYKNYQLDDIYFIYKPQIRRYLAVQVRLDDSTQTLMDEASISLKTANFDTLLTNGAVWQAQLNRSYELKSLGDSLINASTSVQIDKGSPDTTYVTLLVSRIVKEQEIRLNNLYFAFNSDSLTDSSKTELENLYQILLDNAQFKIEIGAHTDNIGKEKYNLELSQKRAQAVVSFLTEKGIDSTRLVAMGYGMSKPIAPNTLENGDDNPEGRKLNRRIVFKILGTISPDAVPADSSKINEELQAPVEKDSSAVEEKTTPTLGKGPSNLKPDLEEEEEDEDIEEEEEDLEEGETEDDTEKEEIQKPIRKPRVKK